MSGTKRLFDVICAVIGLVLLAPLLILIALAIKFDDMGPVFFFQERVGFQGRGFRMCKFRTMVTDADKTGELTVGKDHRITRVGYWLRKTKLDELPQLYNVLVGEMSLVGPRPEVSRYVNLYDQEQRGVLKLIPGITDPASIKYRNESAILAMSANPELTYIEQIMPEKIKINLAYAQRATICSDVIVIMKTIACVLPGESNNA